MNKSICLTNKTAIALRKNAKKMRTVHYAAAVLLSIVMAAAAVYFGIKWLPAVPLMVIACVLLDCIIVMQGRSQYLLIVSQAICTEAAARKIYQDEYEKSRSSHAASDPMENKSGFKMSPKGKESDAQPFFEKGMSEALNQAMLEGKTVVLPASHAREEAADVQDDIPRRRRQQKNLQIIRNQAK